MRITVPASSVKLLLMSMSTSDTMPPKTDMEGNPKLTQDGKAIYAARDLSVLRINDDGTPGGVDKTATISLLTPAPTEFGRVYRPTGSLTITHYVGSNGRLAVSLTADGITPAGKGGEER